MPIPASAATRTSSGEACDWELRQHPDRGSVPGTPWATRPAGAGAAAGRPFYFIETVVEPGLPDELELMIGEYDPTRVTSILSERRRHLDSESSIPVPVRSPQLCPGCGHRTAFYATKKAMGKNKEAFSTADIGCYSLASSPTTLGNLLYCMGSGAPAASAISRAFPSEPVISFVGDSTLLPRGCHAGDNECGGQQT